MNQDLDLVPEGSGLVTGSCVLPRVSPQSSPRGGVGGHGPGSADFLSLASLQLQGEEGSPTAAAATFWLAVRLLAARLGKQPPSLLHLPTTCSLSSCSSTSEGDPRAEPDRAFSRAPTSHHQTCKRKHTSLMGEVCREYPRLLLPNPDFY